jgi:hypothetical protein
VKVERPAVFELVINRRSATAMDLIVPTQLMVRADRVIDWTVRLGVRTHRSSERLRHTASSAAYAPGEEQRQPCSAASQPQAGPQAQAAAAAFSVGETSVAAQPHWQPMPGQSVHWQAGLENWFMKAPLEVGLRTRRVREANSAEPSGGGIERNG